MAGWRAKVVLVDATIMRAVSQFAGMQASFLECG